MKHAALSSLPQTSSLWLSAKQKSESSRISDAQRSIVEAVEDAVRWTKTAARLLPLTERTNGDDIALIVREAAARLGMRVDLICVVSRCRDVVDQTCDSFAEKATAIAERVLIERRRQEAFERDERTFVVEVVGS